MLVDNEATLEKNIFKYTIYCCSLWRWTTIKNNLEKYKAEFGEDVPVTARSL
jgi:dihydroorotase